MHAAHREEALQLLDAVLVGPAVDPEQRGQLVLLQEAGGLDIRRDHAFLDQPVRVVPGIGADLGRVAGGVHQHLDFRRLEIERAALLALLAQRLVDDAAGNR